MILPSGSEYRLTPVNNMYDPAKACKVRIVGKERVRTLLIDTNADKVNS